MRKKIRYHNRISHKKLRLLKAYRRLGVIKNLGYMKHVWIKDGVTLAYWVGSKRKYPAKIWRKSDPLNDKSFKSINQAVNYFLYINQLSGDSK